MKSRRVLQIFVAVLSLAVLVCMALVASMLLVAEHVDVTPQPIVEFSQNFKSGMRAVADRFYLYDEVVPAVVCGVPALLLLLAVILILTKNKGKDTKNIVGCIFALIGVVVLAVFLCVFATDLFAEALLVAGYCASAGLLALFVIFVGCALGVGAKKKPVAAEQAAEQDELPTEQEQHIEMEETVEENFVEEELPNDEAPVEEQQQELPTEQEEEQEQEEQEEATQYVPHLGVTIHDIVERTYGKENDELTKSTIAKINKVRALYDAKAITEQEYIKLINKYLGF